MSRKTRHFMARASQRAIRGDIVDLVLDYGNPEHDGKIVLNCKTLQSFCRQLEGLLKVAKRALSKGGVVVVEEGGALITTYPLSNS